MKAILLKGLLNLTSTTNPDQESPVLGRGMTNPEYYILTTPRDIDMTTEPKPALEGKYTEEQLQDTLAAKGFSAFTAISDIMLRYPFDLKVTRAGRIFVDQTNNTKLRRKPIKGQPQQNYAFEAYKTIENQNRPQAEVEISTEGFTPSMLLAAIASKVANDKDSTYNRLAIMLMQGAAALLQEGNKAQLAVETKLNPEGRAELTQYYNNMNGVHARAYAVSIARDVLQYGVGDNPNMTNTFADNLDYLKNVDDEVHGPGAHSEAMDTINIVLASLTNLAFAPVMNEILIMADEVKANIGEAALVELDDQEQK